MQTRHVILLLDIDNTLIKFIAATPQLQWSGGGIAVWRAYLNALIANNKNIQFHIGIATSKQKFANDHNKEIGLIGDYYSAIILEDNEWMNILNEEITKTQGKPFLPGCGLKNLLNSKLIYFTNAQCKIVNALTPAKAIIEKDFNTVIDDKDIWLIDDQKPICDSVETHGYQAIHAANVCRGSYSEQRSEIAFILSKIFKHYQIHQPICLFNSEEVLPDIECKPEHIPLVKLFDPLSPSRIHYTATDLLHVKPLDGNEDNNEDNLDVFDPTLQVSARSIELQTESKEDAIPPLSEFTALFSFDGADLNNLTEQLLKEHSFDDSSSSDDSDEENIMPQLHPSHSSQPNNQPLAKKRDKARKSENRVNENNAEQKFSQDAQLHASKNTFFASVKSMLQNTTDAQKMRCSIL